MPIIPESPVHPYARYRCLLCGRDKLTRPGQPHKCVGGNYRKRFKRAAEQMGLENAFVRVIRF